MYAAESITQDPSSRLAATQRRGMLVREHDYKGRFANIADQQDGMGYASIEESDADRPRYIEPSVERRIPAYTQVRKNASLHRNSSANIALRTAAQTSASWQSPSQTSPYSARDFAESWTQQASARHRPQSAGYGPPRVWDGGERYRYFHRDCHPHERKNLWNATTPQFQRYPAQEYYGHGNKYSSTINNPRFAMKHLPRSTRKSRLNRGTIKESASRPSTASLNNGLPYIAKHTV